MNNINFDFYPELFFASNPLVPIRSFSSSLFYKNKSKETEDILNEISEIIDNPCNNSSNELAQLLAENNLENSLDLGFVVVIYENADLDKDRIIRENNGKSGVYRRVNRVNGNSYIGSSVNLSIRFRNYFNYSFLTKDTMLINKALLKYGYSNFKLEIFEYCGKANTLKREQYYMNLLKPNYNILKLAGSALGYKQEAIRKIKTVKLGRARSEKTKNKISESLKASIINRTRSANFMAKLGAANGIKVQIHDLISKTTEEYSSYSKAATALHITHSTISKYAKNSKPFRNRFVITFIQE